MCDLPHRAPTATVPAVTPPPRPTTEVDDGLRQSLLDAASELLAEEGPGALTVRRISERAGCSTMGVYSHFGGKEGVVDALFADGFERLHAGMDRIRRTDDPLADLRRCGASYRAFAMANPTHYGVMFGRAVPEFEASEASVEIAHAALGLLEARVQRCLDAGVFDPSHGDAVGIAHGVWGTVHGLVSLELAGVGSEPHPAQRYERTLEALYAGLAQPLAR